MINFAIYLLEFVSVLLIIHLVFQSRFRMDFAAVLLFAVSLFSLFMAYFTQIQLLTYVTQLAFYVYSLHEFHRSWWETLLRIACSIAIIAILETLLMIEIKPWIQTPKYSLYIYLCVSIGVSVCAFILYWFFVCKQIIFGVEVVDKTFIIFVILINVIVFCVKVDGQGSYLRLIICIISIVMFIARFIMISRKKEKESAKKESEWLACYTKQYEKLIQEVRRRQHDYKNEIQTIRMVCATDGDSIAMDLIKEYEDAEQYTTIINGCENPVIAGLIYSKVKEFEEHGVTVLCQLCMRNDGLPLKIREIVDLIGILMDNAFECTMKQKSGKMRFEIMESEKEISIKTSNPSPYVTSSDISKMFTLGFSTKGDNRGIGLHTVRELVKKCHGDIITSNHTIDETNYFDIQVIIPLYNKRSNKD